MKFGFTLAEVLITLGIIGIVAALTLPSVIQNQKNKALVTGLKTAYSIISQSAVHAQSENGNFNSWILADNNTVPIYDSISYFASYLKVAQNCGEQNQNKCWAKHTYLLNGIEETRSKGYSMRLSNGMSLGFLITQLTPSQFGIPDETVPLMLITVDVNGDKKPNTYGRDIFKFAMYKNKVVPCGIANESEDCKTTTNTNFAGWDCTYKVLQENAINY